MTLSSMLTLAASNPVDHVVNQLRGSAPVNIFGMEVWIWSAHVGNLILAGLLTWLLITFAAKRVATGPESQGSRRYTTGNPIAHMIEVICVYLRESTVRPLLHGRTDAYMPFLWTLFFFILINNLLGLAPITDTVHLVDKVAGTHLHGLLGSTATQNIFVTAALAIVAALVINISGLRELGVGGYLKHLTAGTPAYLWPLMVPIEVVGTVIKPVALALRLFANMTAGHIMVAVLFMFAVSGIGLLKGGGSGYVLGPVITGVSFVAAVAIYFLELFVAFLQAFVFMFLTTVFISQLSHHGDHEHHEGHDHEHAHGHKGAHAHAHA